MFPWFVDRFEKEMNALVSKLVKVKVIAMPERKNAAWIGASIWASLSTSLAEYLIS
ncbi:hypothetical protein IID10_17920, partial [candidate division KSB1 bacterium]|nr:hypothetical protein [candidate division KSB1 bacterium]